MSRMLALLVAAGSLAFGCASAPPKTTSQRSELEMEADRAVSLMSASDSTLPSLLDRAAGYVVFPDVKQGGFIVGGAGGKGVLYEHGKPAGFAELSQASVGAQIGGQAYSEIVVLRDHAALSRAKSGVIDDVGAQASAVAVKAGAGSAASFGETGIAVFVQPKGGAMLNISVTGQRIKFTG